jgi:RNA polymerase sigma-70 factor (ECF subfamily)
VFLRMLEAIRQDKTWQTSFSGWLYRIAHNLVVDHFRDRSRTPRVSLDDAPPLRDSGNDPAQIVETRLTQEQLLQALRRLTDDQAQVMVLRFVDGHSIAEVARIMDKSAGAVKGLQYRAAVALRHSLSGSLSLELAIEARTGTDKDAYRRWRRQGILPIEA